MTTTSWHWDAPTSRTVLGPLTTTFTPPPQCSQLNTYGQDPSEATWTRIINGTEYRVFGFAAFTTENICNSPSSDFCVPGATAWGSSAPHFYSPAWVCPQGWTGVATVSSPSTSMISTSWYWSSAVNLNTLLPDETVIICCPTSYTYSPVPPDSSPETMYCSMTVTGVAPTSLFTCGQSTSTVLSTIPTVGIYVGGAQTIQLNFRPQDKPTIVTNTGSSSATTTAAGLSSPGSGSGGSQDQTSGSGVTLPVGAIAGICVGIAALLALVGFLCFLLWRRRRRIGGGGGNRGDANHGSSPQTEQAQTTGFSLKPELDADLCMVHEMQDTDVPPSVVHEMQDTNVPPPRIPGPFEMDGS